MFLGVESQELIVIRVAEGRADRGANIGPIGGAEGRADSEADRGAEGRRGEGRY